MTDVIRDLPRDDRPRERMLMHGAATLSDAELLAVILGSGTPGQNAIELARELLADGIRNLRQRELAQLVDIHGLGLAKVARIGAVFEFARRIASEQPDEPEPFDMTAVGRKLVASYGHLKQERMGAVFLDARHRVQTQREIYIGTINNALVSTRDIIRYTLFEDATSVVVYHNHPSGDPTASDDDIAFTKKLKESLGMCDIELVDHLVIGAHRFQSMKRQALF